MVLLTDLVWWEGCPNSPFLNEIGETRFMPRFVSTSQGREVIKHFTLKAVMPVVFGLLTASVAFGQVDPQFTVNHTPYLQLGNAALGNPNDQIEILWQTLPAGIGTQDSFSTEYRLLGSSTWINAGLPGTIDTGVEGRINHFVPITGLQYDSNYEYRVIHERDGSEVTTFQDSFHTRLAPGDATPFTFVAYGDSAGLSNIANFRGVQSRINQLDASEGVAFTTLLGDNAYSNGAHPEFDTRFDPSINPELTQYNASHIEHYSMGNHDKNTASGLPSIQNYSVPLNGPPVGIKEKHYAFDYGDAHFISFDTNRWFKPAELTAQLDWIVSDMQASDARWKIVFGHNPVAGSPDKTNLPGDDYYQQVVSRFLEAGVDLFLTGHSHTYSWTYPLLGESGGQALFVLDTDKDYSRGAGLVQVVAGTGGIGLRGGDFSPFPFDAAGYSLDTAIPAEFGFAKVDVTSDQLTVSYVAADDGAVIDSFSISHAPEPSTYILLATSVICLMGHCWWRKRKLVA